MPTPPLASGNLLTKKQLAEKLAVSPRSIAYLTASGKIPVFRLTHNIVRYDLARVQKALDRCETPEAGRKK